jgi:predicted dehydrogenase
MTGTPLKAAIVGCGVIGLHHAKVLTAHPRFTASALVDSRPHAIANVRQALPGSGSDVVVASSLMELLAGRERPDLIVIATPSGTHVELATEAVASGAHVVIEKPLDVTVERGRVLAGLAADAATRGQVISVISQHRFDPASQAVHRAIAAGRFGTVSSAVATVAWWRSQEYYDSGDWRGTWSLDGGGATMNQGVHTVDLLRWFLGRPVEVYAATGLFAHERVEVEDTSAAVVRFASGALATILATTAAYPGLSARIQVHGSRGTAVIDNDRLDYFHAAAVGESAGGYGAAGDASKNQAATEVPFAETSAAPTRAEDFLLGHSRQYDDIAAAIETGRAPLVDVNEALLSLALVEAIYRSARSGAPVLVDDVLSGASI